MPSPKEQTIQQLKKQNQELKAELTQLQREKKCWQAKYETLKNKPKPQENRERERERERRISEWNSKLQMQNCFFAGFVSEFRVGYWLTN